MTHYDTLYISRGAPAVVIDAAANALLREYDPQVNTRHSYTELVRKRRDIRDAVAVLLDPFRRAAYDFKIGPHFFVAYCAREIRSLTVVVEGDPLVATRTYVGRPTRLAPLVLDIEASGFAAHPCPLCSAGGTWAEWGVCPSCRSVNCVEAPGRPTRCMRCGHEFDSGRVIKNLRAESP